MLGNPDIFYIVNLESNESDELILKNYVNLEFCVNSKSPESLLRRILSQRNLYFLKSFELTESIIENFCNLFNKINKKFKLNEFYLESYEKFLFELKNP